MLGDINSSSDSCSDSFFLSLSMTLLPLFALCRERTVLPFHLEPMPPAPHQLWSIAFHPYPRLTEHRIPSVYSAQSRAFVSCCWWPLEDVNSLSLGSSLSTNWGYTHKALPEGMSPSHKSRGEAFHFSKPEPQCSGVNWHLGDLLPASCLGHI